MLAMLMLAITFVSARGRFLPRTVAVEIGVHLLCHRFDIERNLQEVGDGLSGGLGFTQNAVVVHPQDCNTGFASEPLMNLGQMALEGVRDYAVSGCPAVAATGQHLVL